MNNIEDSSYIEEKVLLSFVHVWLSKNKLDHLKKCNISFKFTYCFLFDQDLPINREFVLISKNKILHYYLEYSTYLASTNLIEFKSFFGKKFI
jgi:hypothetical protein